MGWKAREQIVTHFYASQTFVDASRKLDDACKWLQRIGVNYSKTRLGRYKQVFSDLAKCQLANTLDAFDETHSFTEWVNAAHEVAEIVRIYEGLADTHDPSLVGRLRDSLRGHELFVLDNDGRSGRDFTFELSVASKFARHGYAINFGADADVETEFGGSAFFVECKRLKSGQSIRKRIKEGLAQLNRRYDASNNPVLARGLLALSIGKVANAQLGWLEADSVQNLGQMASKHNVAFINKYRNDWKNCDDSRTLGVLIILDAPGVLVSENKLITIHEAAVNNCVSTDSPEYQLLISLANSVFANRD